MKKKTKKIEDKINYVFKDKEILFTALTHKSFNITNNYEKLGQYGIYNLWRINKKDLDEYSEFLINSGYKSNWKNILVEKF